MEKRTDHPQYKSLQNRLNAIAEIFKRHCELPDYVMRTLNPDHVTGVDRHCLIENGKYVLEWSERGKFQQRNEYDTEDEIAYVIVAGAIYDAVWYLHRDELKNWKPDEKRRKFEIEQMLFWFEKIDTDWAEKYSRDNRAE